MIRSTAASAGFAAILIAAQPGFAAPEGTKEKHASTSVAETVAAFTAVLEKKGATVFATVDHAKGAAGIGTEIPPSTLVIFGNPKIGTPMMEAAPSMGIELPLKALFHEGEDGKTVILYTDIAAVAARHGIDADHKAVQMAGKALEGLTGAVADKE